MEIVANNQLEGFFVKIRTLAALDRQRRLERIAAGDQKAILLCLPVLYRDADGSLMMRPL